MKTANYDGENKRFILIKHSLPTSRGKEVFRLKSFIKIFSCGDADQQPLQSHTRVTEKLIFDNHMAVGSDKCCSGFTQTYHKRSQDDDTTLLQGKMHVVGNSKTISYAKQVEF